MAEEERFEEWFQRRRRETWGVGYGWREGQPVPEAWIMGFRAWFREGWMARAAADEKVRGDGDGVGT